MKPYIYLDQVALQRIIGQHYPEYKGKTMTLCHLAGIKSICFKVGCHLLEFKYEGMVEEKYPPANGYHYLIKKIAYEPELVFELVEDEEELIPWEDDL